MAKKQGILTEALKEAKALRNAALKNAENSLSGHFRESLEQVVNAQLNEEYEGDGDNVMESDLMGVQDGMGDLREEEEFDFDELGDEGDEDEDDFGGDDEEFADLGEASDCDVEDDEDELAEAMGFSESDIASIVGQILDEVDHGQLGDFDDVTEDQHDSGLLDQDMKENGWEEKTVPAKKDWTVKETKRLRAKLARVVAENAALKKANVALKEAVAETNLFNRKMLYAHKLLNNKNLTEGVKVKIMKRLDGASSEKEARSIYESIEAVLGVVSESKRPRRGASTLSETIGRQTKRTEKGITHVDDAHLLNEGKRFGSHRLQVLAGIKNLDE